MGDDEIIYAQIVQVLPVIRETSTLLGDENVPLEEWKRCLVNANQRIAELEGHCEKLARKVDDLLAFIGGISRQTQECVRSNTDEDK